MSHELREGVKLDQILLTDDVITLGKGGCEDITVRDQVGQMAMVPWAEVTLSSGTKFLYNLALVEGVSVLRVQQK